VYQRTGIFVGADISAMTLAGLTPAFLDLAFVRGLVVGFALAAPMGPVAILCIRRALTCGRLQAFGAGMGAAFADMIFGAVAGLGITVISSFIMNYQTAIGLVGGVVVLAMGITTYRTPVVMTNGNVVVKSLRREFAAAFTMAMTNPATMIAAIGVFAAFGPIDIQTSPARAFWLVAGVLTGSAAWWLILAGVAATMRGRFVARGLPWLNRVSGSIIALSGAVVLVVALVQVLDVISRN
jgi:threonine/homoserine/homoserine lactone efflux protein